MTEAALTIVPPPKKRGTRPMVQRSVQEAIAIKQLLLKDMADPKTTPLARAALARSWAVVQDSIRIMRGIPLPGHLQPGAESLKKAKRGKLIELAAAPTETPDTAPSPAKVAKVTTTTPTTDARADETKIELDTKPETPPNTPH